MLNRLSRQIFIPMSACDNTGRLGCYGTVNLFMDMATEHGEMLGVGGEKLAPKGLIWVAAKTRIHFNSKPKMLSQAEIATWPEKPARIRFNRYYSLSDGENLLVEGKTEWAILDLNTGRPHRLDETYPVDMEHCTDVVCDIPFSRTSTDFEGCQQFGSYTVTASDIDVSQHMNNVAYIRAVLGAFTTKEIEDMNITDMEICYRLQCFEGENLTFRRRTAQDGTTEIGVIKADGKTAATMRIG
jgi:acyl-ACP thioesterase